MKIERLNKQIICGHRKLSHDIQGNFTIQIKKIKIGFNLKRC